MKDLPASKPHRAGGETDARDPHRAVRAESLFERFDVRYVDEIFFRTDFTYNLNLFARVLFQFVLVRRQFVGCLAVMIEENVAAVIFLDAHDRAVSRGQSAIDLRHFLVRSGCRVNVIRALTVHDLSPERARICRSGQYGQKNRRRKGNAFHVSEAPHWDGPESLPIGCPARRNVATKISREFTGRHLGAGNSEAQKFDQGVRRPCV